MPWPHESAKNLVKVLVLYYSRTGSTQALAEAVKEGVNSIEGAEASLKRVDFATTEDLVTCDAVAFGSPNYFGYIAGLMKDFFDKALIVREKVSGKPAAAFSSGGSSSTPALLILDNMISAFRLEKVVKGVASVGVPTDKDLDACRKLGEALAKAAVKRAKEPRE